MKIRRSLMLGALLFLTAAAVRAEEEPALPPEAREILQKLAGIQSYKVRFSMEAKEPDGKLFQLEGTFLYQAPNSRRLEIHRPESKEEPQLLVSDGKVEWQYDPEAGTVYRLLNPKEAPGPHRPFSEAKGGTVRFVGRQTDEAGEFLRFEAEPIPESVSGSPIPVQKIQIDVDSKNGLMRQLILLGAGGDAVMTQRFSDPQVNVPVSGKQFTFVPQQGMAVVDLP